MKQFLVIDVGGTAIKYSLMDEEANLLEKGETPTNLELGLEGYLDNLFSIYKQYEGKVEAIAMSAPGKIDAIKGYFYTGGALSFISNFDMKKAMEEQGWKTVVNEKLIVELIHHWQDHRIRDCSNSLKLLCDSIQNSGIVNNDRWLLCRQQDFDVDRENPRLELVIYKKENDKQ